VGPRILFKLHCIYTLCSSQNGVVSYALVCHACKLFQITVHRACTHHEHLTRKAKDERCLHTVFHSAHFKHSLTYKPEIWAWSRITHVEIPLDKLNITAYYEINKSSFSTFTQHELQSVG